MEVAQDGSRVFKELDDCLGDQNFPAPLAVRSGAIEEDKHVQNGWLRHKSLGTSILTFCYLDLHHQEGSVTSERFTLSHEVYL